MHRMCFGPIPDLTSYAGACVLDAESSYSTDDWSLTAVDSVKSSHMYIHVHDELRLLTVHGCIHV